MLLLDGPESFAFFAPALDDPFGLGIGAAPPPSPAPTPTALSPVGGPVVARQPTKDDGTRQRRALDRWADVANALATRGDLVQTDAHGWRLRPRLFVEAGAPTVDDDEAFGAMAGDLWIDTAGVAVYACVSASAGAATWVLLGLHA